MKKYLYLILLLLFFCGCNKEKNNYTLETTCTKNAMLNDYRMNYYTWVIEHNGELISNKSWMRSYEYETLSEAIEEEIRAKKDCQDKDYYCDVSRNQKIITYYISYTCGSSSISDNDNCNYLDELKTFEQSGWECTEEKDTNE